MENDIDFKTYLISKKIDSDRFLQAEASHYHALASIFVQMHPDSFTAQKLFLINPLRRKYLLEETIDTIPSRPKMKFKPKIR